MKKAVTFRVDPELLTEARVCALREHRTLTNFIELSLRNRIEQLAAARPASSLTLSEPEGTIRGS